MKYASIRRAVPVFLLGSVLVSSPVLASSLSRGFAEEVGRVLLVWVTGSLQSADRAETKRRCIADSDGQLVCEPVAPVPSLKHGCTIDPSGTPRCNS